MRDAGGACARRNAAAIAPVAARGIVVAGGGGSGSSSGRFRGGGGCGSLTGVRLSRGAEAGGTLAGGPGLPVRVWWHRKLQRFPYCAREGARQLTGGPNVIRSRMSVKGP
jgi:hypothetical protein